MPRLRAARTKEEAEAVPAEQAIQIELPVEGEITLEADPVVKDKEKEKVVKEEPKVREAEIEPKPEVSAEQTGLLKQIEDLKKAEKLAQDNLVAERKRSEEADKRARDATAENVKAREETAQAQYDAIVNALSGAQAEAESAKQALEAAEISGDVRAKIDAYSKLATATANISRLEDGKFSFETKQEKLKTEAAAKAESPEPQKQTVQSAQELPPAAQTWLASHPEYMTDSKKNRAIQAVHNYVVENEGVEAFSPQYFESVEVHLGLKKKPEPKTEEVEERTEVVTQAPPTRDVPSAGTGKPTSSKVTLTPQQREHARISGTDEVTYAKGVQELERRRANGMLQER